MRKRRGYERRGSSWRSPSESPRGERERKRAEHGIADRTAGQVDAGELVEPVLPGQDGRFGSVVIRGREAEAVPCNCEFVGVRGGEQAVVSDLDETSGQDVVEKPRDELLGAEGDGLSVLGCEADPLAVDSNEPMRRDGDPVGVAPEVFEESLGPGEGTLGVNQPVFPIEFVFEQAKSFFLIDGKLGAVTDAPVVEGSRELVEELASEKLGEGLDGKKISGTGRCPIGKTLVEPATGNDAM